LSGKFNLLYRISFINDKNSILSSTSIYINGLLHHFFLVITTLTNIKCILYCPNPTIEDTKTL